jgi:hypothetical protein
LSECVKVDTCQFLRLLKGNLVSLFMLSVVLVFLLDGVVRQMHSEVVKSVRLECVLLAGHSYVALLEAEALVFVRDEDPHADVELALLNKQRLLNVLLNYKHIRLN